MPVRPARLSGYSSDAATERVRSWRNNTPGNHGLALFVPPPPQRPLMVTVNGTGMALTYSKISDGSVVLLFGRSGDKLTVAFFDLKAGAFLPAIADGLSMTDQMLLSKKAGRAHSAYVSKLVRLAQSYRVARRVNA